MIEEASPNTKVTPKSSKRASSYNRRASGSQWKIFSNVVGNEGLNLRRSVRAASLNSPYASPVTVNRRRYTGEADGFVKLNYTWALFTLASRLKAMPDPF